MRAEQLDDGVRTVLPRGRHALSRAQVTASQRARLLRAMTDEVAERGFAATTAAGVYQRAGVSSRAFYESFTDVTDCFLAAYEHSVRVVTQTAFRVVDSSEPPARRDPLAQFTSMLDTYLWLIANEPNMARTFLIEVYGAGAVALERRLQVHEQFVEGVQRVLAPGRRLDASDRFAVESLVDAITFCVTRSIAAGELGDLTSLRDDLLGVARRLCPWL